MKNLILCDSGLGGLDIAAPFFQKKESSEWNLIYVNAFPDPKFGFNDLADSRMQEEVFQAVLEGMERFSPALCMIACNTLSIVWQRLSKRYRPSFPVVGIIEKAVDAMTAAAESEPESQLLILGTDTTVSSNVYPEELSSRGIQPERIHSLACPGLAKKIEADPASPDLAELISGYAQKAAELLRNVPGKLFLCFCCTHYGYAEKFWRAAFLRHFPDVETVNPNRAMLLDGRAETFAYYARVPLGETQRNAMADWFAFTAPPITKALRHTQPDGELFHLPPEIRLKNN